MWRCGRCGTDMLQIESYGAYDIIKGKDLCKLCAKVWEEMKRRHFLEEQTFWLGVDTVKETNSAESKDEYS